MQSSGGRHYSGMRRPAHQPTRHRGFTLVELLVVIGIIVVLVGVITAGVRHTRSLAVRQETRAELKLCEDLLTEYKSVNGYKNILGPLDSATANLPVRLPSGWITGQFNTPMFVYPLNNGYTEVKARVINPASTLTIDNFNGGLTNRDAKGRGFYGDYSDTSNPNNPRWVSDALRWTQGVMYLLLKDPANRALIGTLPPSRLLESMPAPIDKDGNVIGKAGPPYTIDAAVPLDGWRNPILFVPPGGMHVWMDPTGNNTKPTLADYIIRTSGVYPASNAPPVGPNDRPFFASAGLNGFFTTTDTTTTNAGPLIGHDLASDNLYSFQEQ
jgi:prepilin-type N-terminal cleavage/methylation domain-containing protein